MFKSNQVRARRILALYAAGERNFRGRNLSGSCFKGQDLSGADFSQTDLCGVDFTKANLTRSHFREANAGIGAFWQVIAQLLGLLLGLLAGFLSTRIAVPIVSSSQIDQAAGMVSLMTLILFCGSIYRLGLPRGSVITIGFMAFWGTLTGAISVGMDQVALGYTTLEAADSSILSTTVIGALCLFLAISKAIVGHSYIFALLGAITGAVSIPLMASGPIAENLSPSGAVLSIAISIVIVQFCLTIAHKALVGDPHHALIRNFAVTIVATLGTRFYQADLTEADFSHAELAYTDLRARCLDYARWDQAQGLDSVRWGSHNLRDVTVRHLMITRSCEDLDNLSAINLAGTDLSQANLYRANLKGANLLKAKLEGANLEQSNLTLVQALGTDFTGARMTGSCLEGWAIDGTTRLEKIDCAFVYRLEQAKPGTEDRERQPSSGKFEPGDFTKLFQVVLNTVELIFRQGIDREALAAALRKVQDNYDPNIKLQGVEDKGDGFVKVTLGVPAGIQKADLHQDFKQVYQDQLKQLEDRYQAELNTAKQQIEHYQQTTTELTSILKHLTEQAYRPEQLTQAPNYHRPSDQYVILTFWDGSLEQGYPITADIRVGTLAEPLKFHASLPPAPELTLHYQQWQTLYRQTFGTCSRIQFEDQLAMTNVSHQELNCLADRLAHTLQSWLQAPTFRLISDKLREKFLPDQDIRILIQTEDIWLRRLPWHLWQFLQDYPKAEVALGGMSLENRVTTPKIRTRTRILAILGNSVGINVGIDRQLLQTLDQSNIEVVFLQEPNRQQFNESLWDPQGWDIFYFSGHSYSQRDGHSGVMQLNAYDQISIEDLQFALAEAVNRDLQLAVFNSCDGLGLASTLCDLKIPQIVVMKEPVPDRVAQCFLDYFLQALTQEKTLYSAVRKARQRLSSLEEQYPFASWLPTLFQASAAVKMPTIKALSPTAENARSPDSHSWKFES